MGFLVGFFLTVAARQSVWLEMHVNTGVVVPITVLLFAFGFRKKLPIHSPVVVFLELLLLFVFLLAYRFEWLALSVVPASLLREGLYATNLSLSQANVILGLIFLAGNVAWVAPPFFPGRFSCSRAGKTPG